MPSKFLSDLSASARADLEVRLLQSQGGRCFVCEEPLDYELQKKHLDIDHIQPLADRGKDDPTNFALAHEHCNRSKQAADLRVARVLARFDKIRKAAQDAGRDAPNLDDVLSWHSGPRQTLSLVTEDSKARYTFPHLEGHDATKVHEAEIHTDHLSGMRYFFGMFPLAYLHHDDRINPRGIGSSLRGLVEEFFRRRPQLHITLGWITTTGDSAFKLRLFDGQHKAAAQILLGTKEIPVRVFVDPDPDALLQANTNAGTSLRQVAFDKSIVRHLGNALYRDRIERFRRETGRGPTDADFSEKDLVAFFSGEARQMRGYILDNVRDGITHHPDNRLRPYIDLGGRANAKPLSYSTIDKSFYSFFIGSNILTSRLDFGLDTGDNPRELEISQIVRLMNLIAEAVFERQFYLELGTFRLENKVQGGENIPSGHMRAFRMAKEEILYNWLSYIKQIITTFYAFQGTPFTEAQLFQTRHPEKL